MATSSSGPLIGLSTASVYPESTAHAFGLGGAAGLRRGRGDGRHRRAEPAGRRGQEAQRPPPGADLRDARPVPALHPAGLGHRPVGQARAVGRDGRRRSAPTWSSCTRRSGGRRTTPPASSRASRPWRRAPASPSRSRTCTRGGRPRAAGWRCTCPAGTPARRTTPTPRSTCPTRRSPRSDVIEMADRMGDRLRHVHLTDGTGSAKDEHLVPGRGVMRAEEFLEHLAGTRLRRPRRARDQHPPRRQPERARGRPGRVAGVRPRAPRAYHAMSAGETCHPRVPRPPPRRARHPGRGPRRRAGVVRREGLPGYDDPRRRGLPPASTPRSCTTTSAARTTSSSPRWRCPSTRASSWLRWSPGAGRRRRAAAAHLPVGLGRPGDPAAAARGGPLGAAATTARPC